jgi:hypothetical protein
MHFIHEFLKMTSPSVLVTIEHTGMQKKNLPSALLTASLLVTVTPGKLERECVKTRSKTTLLLF